MTRRAPEKKVEKAGDELMALFGFTAIRFSQARATQQTRGIPDRLYMRPNPLNKKPLLWHGCVVWWEAKAATKQSKHQRAFQELVESCGETYLCGGVAVLQHYLVKSGLARYVPAGIEGVRHSA